MILINELTQKLNYNTITFGLLNDWWQYEDEKLRIKGSPLFTNQQWSKLLSKNGFVNNEIKGIDSNNPKSMAQSLIVGKK